MKNVVTLSAPANLWEPETDTELPNLNTPLRDRLLPREEDPMTLKLDREPTWDTPATERPLPNRANPLRLREEPRDTWSKDETFDPILESPLVEQSPPAREEPRTERLRPSTPWAEALRPLPNLRDDRTLTDEPRAT